MTQQTLIDLAQGLDRVTKAWMRSGSTIGADHLLRLDRFQKLTVDSPELRTELENLGAWLRNVAEICVAQMKDAHLALAAQFDQALQSL